MHGKYALINNVDQGLRIMYLVDKLTTLKSEAKFHLTRIATPPKGLPTNSLLWTMSLIAEVAKH